MVQILPFLGAAALLAQSAFGAAVPVRRQYSNSNSNSNSNSYSNSNSNSNNNYEVSSNNSNQYNSNQSSNNYDSSSQNQYNQNSNQYNQNSNQYNNQNSNSNSYSQGSSGYNSNQSNNYNNNNQYSQESNQYSTQESNQYNNNQYNNQYQGTTTSSEATQTVEATSIETTSASYEMPSYGSGSSSSSGYNDCVSQCMAQFGAPPSAVTMDSSEMSESESTGTNVHTVMVAPDGVGLRYVPFAVNASMGDTIHYVWTTGLNHTVTLSSALTICNRSALATERNFASGIRNGSPVAQSFDVTVQTEDPQFYYCSVAEHCINGMFGVVNPGSDTGNANNVGLMMGSVLSSNPQLSAAWSYIRQNISDQSVLSWGNDISLEGYSQSQITEVISNVMFTRAVYGANPGMLAYGRGAANPDGSPVMIPQGLDVLLSSTANATTTDGVANAASAVPTPTGTQTIVTPLSNGAFSAKGGASIWAAAFVGVLGYLLI